MKWQGAPSSRFLKSANTDERTETCAAVLLHKWSSKTTPRLSHVASMVQPSSGTSPLAHPKPRCPARSSPSPRRRPEPSSGWGVSWSRRRATWCWFTMLMVARPVTVRGLQWPFSALQALFRPSAVLATKSASGARAAPCCTCVPPGLWRREFCQVGGRLFSCFVVLPTETAPTSACQQRRDTMNVSQNGHLCVSCVFLYSVSGS